MQWLVYMHRCNFFPLPTPEITSVIIFRRLVPAFSWWVGWWSHSGMAGVLGEGTHGLHFSDLEREESQWKILLQEDNILEEETEGKSKGDTEAAGPLMQSRPQDLMPSIFCSDETKWASVNIPLTLLHCSVAKRAAEVR